MCVTDQYNSYVCYVCSFDVLQLVGDKTYMLQLLDIQRKRGVTHGEVFRKLLLGDKEEEGTLFNFTLLALPILKTV